MEVPDSSTVFHKNWNRQCLYLRHRRSSMSFYSKLISMSNILNLIKICLRCNNRITPVQNWVFKTETKRCFFPNFCIKKFFVNRGITYLILGPGFFNSAFQNSVKSSVFLSFVHILKVCCYQNNFFYSQNFWNTIAWNPELWNTALD